MSTSNRRKFLGRGAAAAAVAAVPAAAQESAGAKPTKRVIYGKAGKPKTPPLFSSTVAYGNLLFIAGVGYHEAHFWIHQPHAAAGSAGEVARAVV